MSEYKFVERPFLTQLKNLGWEVIDQGDGIPTDPTKSRRTTFREMTLKEVFREQVRVINTLADGRPWLTDQQLEHLYGEITDAQADKPLLVANEGKAVLGVRPDAVARVLEAARWAPSGGNRQPVRIVVVRDAASRARLRDLYLPRWEAYSAPYQEGLKKSGAALPRVLAGADHFARHLAEVPVLLVVCFRVADVLPTDAGLGRVSVVGGASIYPAVQNVLLKARDEGLGAALTTLLCADEPAVKALLAIPEEFGTAALLGLGWPGRPFPRRLSRRPLSEIAFGERFGAPLED